MSCLCSNDGVLSRHNLKPIGDGVSRGTIVKNANTLTPYGYGSPFEFVCDTWNWRIGVQREQDTSRYLDRLAVLKELFNVFINRAVGLHLVFGCAS